MINCEDTNLITQTCDEQQTRVKNRVYDIYRTIDENRSLHKEKIHYLGTPFLKQVYIYITVIPMATVYMATSYTKH
jgi:hypothetical protein